MTCLRGAPPYELGGWSTLGTRSFFWQLLELCKYLNSVPARIRLGWSICCYSSKESKDCDGIWLVETASSPLISTSYWCLWLHGDVRCPDKGCDGREDGLSIRLTAYCISCLGAYLVAPSLFSACWTLTPCDKGLELERANETVESRGI